MKKMMIALCAIAATMNILAASFNEEYESKIQQVKADYVCLTNALVSAKTSIKEAKNEVESTSAKALKAKTEEAIELNEEMTERLSKEADALKTSNVGEFNSNNAFNVSMRRLNRGQKLIIEGKSWFFPSKEERAAETSNKIILENAVKEAKGDDKLDLIWEIQMEKFGK